MRSLASLALLLPTLAHAGDGGVLFASDPGDDRFGWSVALDGNYAVVGAPDYDTHKNNSGAAHVFDLTTGAELHTFIGSVPRAGGLLGLQVAASDGRALVSTTKVCYLFEVATGTELFKWKPSTVSLNHGWQVALDGDLAVIGVPDDPGRGTVFVYDVTSGAIVNTIKLDNAVPGEKFGYRVELQGTTLFASTWEGSTGAVHVIDALTGVTQRVLNPSADALPSSMAQDGDLVVYGSAWLGTGVHAFVFDWTTGAELAVLTSDHPDTDLSAFAQDVAIEGDTILVGDWRSTGQGLDSGALHVFDASTMTRVTKLHGFQGDSWDQFGRAVTIDGGRVLVGAPEALVAGLGAAYVFDGIPDWTTTCSPAVLNSTGRAATLVVTGSDLVADDCLFLRASNLPENNTAYFLNSQTQGFVQPPGSSGNLCLAGGIGRYVAQVQSSGFDGTISLLLDLDQTPTPGGSTAIQPGETWSFQAWYRDPPTTNFTDAVAVTFE